MSKTRAAALSNLDDYIDDYFSSSVVEHDIEDMGHGFFGYKISKGFWYKTRSFYQSLKKY